MDGIGVDGITVEVIVFVVGEIDGGLYVVGDSLGVGRCWACDVGC